MPARSSRRSRRSTTSRAGGRAIALAGLDDEVALPERMATGIAEFDRALGGGFVEGSATLIGGDPGIGKSTLLLQAAAKMALRGLAVAYVSGEEAADQVRLRARRLGLGNAPVQLAAATSVRDILTTLWPGRAAGAAGDRFDPDDAFGPDRGRARARSARSARRRRS